MLGLPFENELAIQKENGVQRPTAVFCSIKGAWRNPETSLFLTMSTGSMIFLSLALILFKASKPYLPLKFSFNKVSTEKLKNYNLGCHALIVIQVTSTVRWWSIFKNRCRMDRITTILFWNCEKISIRRCDF